MEAHKILSHMFEIEKILMSKNENNRNDNIKRVNYDSNALYNLWVNTTCFQLRFHDVTFSHNFELLFISA